MSMTLEEELNSHFVSPEAEFMGEKLAPYTEGSRLLMMQVRGDDDSPVYFIWSFLYIHIILAKDKKEAIKLAWNKDLFREKVIDWMDNKTQQDRDTASALVASIIEKSNKGQIEVIPTPGQSQEGNA